MLDRSAVAAARATLAALRGLLVSNLCDAATFGSSASTPSCKCDADATLGVPGCPRVNAAAAMAWADAGEALLLGASYENSGGVDLGGGFGGCEKRVLFAVEAATAAAEAAAAVVHTKIFPERNHNVTTRGECPGAAALLLPASLATLVSVADSKLCVSKTLAPLWAIFQEQREAIIDQVALSSSPTFNLESSALFIDGALAFAASAFALALAALLGDIVVAVLCCVPCRGKGRGMGMGRGRATTVSAAAAAAARSSTSASSGAQKGIGGAQKPGGGSVNGTVKARTLYPSPTPHTNSSNSSPSDAFGSPGAGGGAILRSTTTGFGAPVAPHLSSAREGGAAFKSPPPPAHLAAALARLGVLGGGGGVAGCATRVAGCATKSIGCPLRLAFDHLLPPPFCHQ